MGGEGGKGGKGEAKEGMKREGWKGRREQMGEEEKRRVGKK